MVHFSLTIIYILPTSYTILLNNGRFIQMNTTNIPANKNTAHYLLKQATPENTFEIWNIMDFCHKNLTQKDFFICDDLEYVKDILSGNGFGVIACDNTGKIVGNLLVKYPGLEEENLGYDIFPTCFKPSEISGQPYSLEELQKVVHMDSASVLPDHRGHHLESRMIAFGETLIDTSRYSYAFATVAPENTASLKSLMRNGYQIMDTKEKYGGVLRYILMKHLI